MRQFLLISLLFPSVVFSQLYVGTKNVWAIGLNAAPLAKAKYANDRYSYSSFGLQGHKMIFSGIYFYLGVSAQKFHNTTRNETFLNQHGQTWNSETGLLLDKRLICLMQKRVRGICHKVNLGILAETQYAYTFGFTEKNNSIGGISGSLGLSIYHDKSVKSRRSKGNTWHLDGFYQYGFTPVFTTSGTSGNDLTMRGIYIRLRFVHQQQTDFTK